MVLNATFNTISVIPWRQLLLVEETRVHLRKPPTYRKSLTNFITWCCVYRVHLALNRVQIHNFSGDRHCIAKVVVNPITIWSWRPPKLYWCLRYLVFLYILLLSHYNRIGGVMVSVLVSSVVDHEFEPRVGQPKTIKLVFAAKHAALRRKSKTGRLGIRIMWPSGATCLPADCCFSELAL